MKKYLLLLITLCSVCLLDACGGGGSSSGGATHFSVSAPSPVASGSSFELAVTALDAHNNLATHYAGTVHFTSTDAQATLPSDSTYDGVENGFSVTLNTIGNQTITVTDMQSKIVGVTTPISVSAPTAAKFLLSTPFSATAGTSFTFTVTAVDSTGATFTGYAGTVTFTSSDPQVQLPANSTLTNGKETFSGTLKTDGNQTITATDSVAASITGTSTSIHVLAPASGFTPTGGMLYSREAHTATILNDGTVLVAGGAHWVLALGGCSNFGQPKCLLLPLDSAEIYDPATGAFRATGKMSVARESHTATALADGRVLITGGDDRSTTYATAEIFDPSTGVFTPTGNMVVARSSHTATLLANGKVLLAGGYNGSASLTAELFDPATGQFTATGNMSAARYFHTATLLNDGKVLLAGGYPGTAGSAELFDPATGTFTPTGSMSVARSAHRATLLKSGAVLMTGGASSDGITATTELFDPATGAFAPTGSMTTARELHTATMLPNGKVLVTGGIDAMGTVGTIQYYLSTAEMFDPASGTFTAAGNMEIERSGHAAILLSNGEVLITGGIDADNAENLNSLGSAELFP